MASEKEVVALDIDGVLADFIKQFYRIAPIFFGDKYSNTIELGLMPINEYLGLDKETESNLVETMFSDVFGFPAMEGAMEGCSKLIDSGYDLMIVTKRKNVSDTADWLNLHGLGDIPLYFMDFEKNNIPEFDYLLDDRPSKIAELYPLLRKKAYLMECVNNVDCNDFLGRYERVKDWKDFIDKFLNKREGV